MTKNKLVDTDRVGDSLDVGFGGGYPDFQPFRVFESLSEKSFIEAQYSGPLYGRVRVAGAKNMVTKVIAASLSGEKGVVKIKNIPLIGELGITLSLCKRLGIPYRVNPDRTLEMSVGDFENPDVKFDPYFGNRTSILFAGPVLNKLGEANISKPEGCEIGDRKVDFHLGGLEKLGVTVEENDDYFHLELTGNKLKGAEIELPFPSVGATENLIIAASVAEGVTTIRNVAIEPEIMQMVRILQRSGVPIEIRPNREIRVYGGPHKIVDTIDVVSDRVETFSWAVVALTTKGDIFVEGAKQEHLMTPISYLQRMGAGIEIRSDGIRFFYKGPIKPVNITTEVYPGFVTDLQQPMAVLLSQCQGGSTIHETVFENRFKYLHRLGKISDENAFVISHDCPEGDVCRFKGLGHPHLARIKGPVESKGGGLEIDDLRAGFAVLTAGLLSREKSIIKNVRSLYRGYEDPVAKLLSLGANVSLQV